MNAHDPIHSSPDYEAKKIKAILATRIMVVIVIALVVIIVAVQLFTTLQIRSAQKVNANNTRITKDLAEQIRSCTSPTGECSKQNARKTAGVVGVIGQGEVLAASAASWCAADRPGQTFEQILRCTIAHVKTAKKGKP